DLIELVARQPALLQQEFSQGARVNTLGLGKLAEFGQLRRRQQLAFAKLIEERSATHGTHILTLRKQRPRGGLNQPSYLAPGGKSRFRRSCFAATIRERGFPHSLASVCFLVCPGCVSRVVVVAPTADTAGAHRT